MNVEKMSLRENHQISRIIKGGWQLAGDHGNVQRKKAIQDMETFLEFLTEERPQMGPQGPFCGHKSNSGLIRCPQFLFLAQSHSRLILS